MNGCWLRLVACAVAVAFAACDGSGTKGPEAKGPESKGAATGGETTGTTTGPERVGAGTSGRAFPADAPPTQSCKVDADCTMAVDAPVGSDPCCNVTVTAMPIAVRYVQFMDQWRKGNCAGVSCPPLSLPGAQPALCGLTARCNAGTCDNSCGLAPDGAAPPSR